MSGPPYQNPDWAFPYGASFDTPSQQPLGSGYPTNTRPGYGHGGQVFGFDPQVGFAVYHGYDMYPEFVQNQAFQMSLSEQIKHRRSRYGCYTCRSRRIKCDETHPVCERCRKSNRECVFPNDYEMSSSTRKDSKTKATTEADKSTTKPPGINRDDPSETLNQSSLIELTSSPGSDQSSQASSSRSKVFDGKRHSSQEQSSVPSVPAQRPVSVNDPTLQYYLDFQRTSMSHHHYGFVRDDNDFVHSFMQMKALEYPPLLYAIVAFSAYIYCMSKEDGELKDFLPFYSEALNRLRDSLKSETPSINTLLAILQLALLEEYLGDWVNVVSHQEAALKLITTLLTPEIISTSELHNKILQWYIRFDVFSGFMSGTPIKLPRDYFVAQVSFWESCALRNPTRLGPKYEERNASGRLIAVDLSILFDEIRKGHLSTANIVLEAAEIRERLQNMYDGFDPMLLDSARAIRTVPRSELTVPDPEDAAGVEEELLFYTGDNRTTNHLLCIFWPMELMFEYQMSMSTQQPPAINLKKLALRILKLFELIERVDFTSGSTFGVQPALGVAAITLRNEPALVMWCRKQLAKIESKGYIHPSGFRQRMSDAWGVDVTEWWLPNNDGYKPVGRAIRNFVAGRTSRVKSKEDEDLRDLTGVFTALTLSIDKGQSSSPEGGESDRGLQRSMSPRDQRVSVSPQSHRAGSSPKDTHESRSSEAQREMNTPEAEIKTQSPSEPED